MPTITTVAINGNKRVYKPIRKPARPTLRTLIATKIIYDDQPICVYTGRSLKDDKVQINHKRKQPVINGTITDLVNGDGYLLNKKVIRLVTEWSIPRLSIVVEE